MNIKDVNEQKDWKTTNVFYCSDVPLDSKPVHTKAETTGY